MHELTQATIKLENQAIMINSLAMQAKRPVVSEIAELPVHED
jgi:hypothetical protein